ncbi:hypothetical protein C7212DRAFT_346973 [Tuber magnatum]|uniref:Uncharacterized protein n=1 Tax=Tuber magnatum TaxID=42249 RepID=A0A317SFS4_9PEZI|nr:hypothetical protein C7212DRAFT_346973 [Tuber magnatum]
MPLVTNQISNLMVISNNSYGGGSRRYVTTILPSSPESETARLQKSTPYSVLSRPLLHPNHANPRPPTLTCPVPSCSLVFKGESAYGYLWRHIRRPGIYRRTGGEKDARLRLHKVEHDLLVATGITPVQRKREKNRVRAQKVSRAAGFELRARDMGVTEKVLVAQKVAIWEGMYAAKLNGDSIGPVGPSLGLGPRNKAERLLMKS